VWWASGFAVLVLLLVYLLGFGLSLSVSEAVTRLWFPFGIGGA